MGLTKRCSQPLAGRDAVIRVYDAAGNVIETHEHSGEFQRAVTVVRTRHAIKEIFGFVRRNG